MENFSYKNYTNAYAVQNNKHKSFSYREKIKTKTKKIDKGNISSLDNHHKATEIKNIQMSFQKQQK